MGVTGRLLLDSQAARQILDGGNPVPVVPPAKTLKSGFLPEAFHWLHPDEMNPARERPSVVRISRGRIRISGPVAARFQGVEFVEVGITPMSLAIRPASGVPAWRLRRDRKGRGRMPFLGARPLIRTLTQKGFGPGVVLPAVWDEASGMLVATKPREEPFRKPSGVGMQYVPRKKKD